MTALNLAALETALDALPKRFPGPGGVAGVVKDGKIIASRAWGYLNVETAEAMTRGTRLPICSVSKQFTCQALLAELGEPSGYDDRIAAYLPKFTGTLPTIRQLCDMQSGLRDYWALTVLQGGRAEQVFRFEDAMPVVAKMKTGHFPPGTAYSYCNCNFRILREIIEAESGKGLEELYQRHVFGPAGMKTAVQSSDTSKPEDGVVGYEGNDASGWFPADNRIFWIGDAGIAASLDDMLAYETWIDATREDENSLYRRISVTPEFSDGNEAGYGYGLMFEEIAGRKFSGHSGALRGFRAKRVNCREDRLSVVVLFNHEANTTAAITSLVEAAYSQKSPAPGVVPDGWDGQFLADDGLLTTITSHRHGVGLAYNGWGPDLLDESADGSLAAPGISVRREGDGLVMARKGDNSVQRLAPLPVVDTADASEIAGTWHSDELEADLIIEARDGAAYAQFRGLLGTGKMERMAPAGKDVWILATRRSMDAPAPGDWTAVFTRDAAGRLSGMELGCWLARGVPYQRA